MDYKVARMAPDRSRRKLPQVSGKERMVARPGVGAAERKWINSIGK